MNNPEREEWANEVNPDLRETVISREPGRPMPAAAVDAWLEITTAI